MEKIRFIRMAPFKIKKPPTIHTLYTYILIDIQRFIVPQTEKNTKKSFSYLLFNINNKRTRNI